MTIHPVRSSGRAYVVFFALALSCVAPFAPAQETASGLSGRVVDAGGAPLAGAQVTVTHVPTGTRTTAVSNAEGEFFAGNLRVGGPFKVEASLTNYEPGAVEEIYTTLGQAQAVNVVLGGGEALQEVVIQSGREREISLGVTTEFTSRDIAALPSISRDVKSIIRVDPKVQIDPTNVDAIQIAGNNNRFNTLTVDGVRQSDDFGLNNNGYPTDRSPVSLDAVEAVSVLTAPFDVQYSFFQGGTINVVTKSGTNEFEGTAFFYAYRDDLVGDETKDRQLAFDFEEEVYGATIGGPILRDKLFFFASYENVDRLTPVEFGPAASSFPIRVSGVSQADFDQILAITQNTYRFNPGSLSSDFPADDEKILTKIDWNITDSHRASLSYQKAEGGSIVDPISSSASNLLGAPSQWYNRAFVLEQLGLQVFSNWTPRLTTELKIGRKEVEAAQDSLQGADFAQMSIVTSGGGTVLVGPDRFRHANDGANDLNLFKLKADYILGDHTLTAGFELEQLEIFNLFVDSSEGRYTFNSIADFAARRASQLVYQNSFTNDELDAAATFGYDVRTFYVQDKWRLSPRLTVQAGVRFDQYVADDQPAFNQNFLNRNGFSNTETLDGRELISPRLGFNWQVRDDTVLRGGVGLFGGGTPNVWVSNSFSNDGVTVVSQTINANPMDPFAVAALTNVDGFNVAGPVLQRHTTLRGDGSVNAIAPDFEIPSVWRWNFGVDHRFGEDWLLSFDLLYSNVKDAVIWRDLRLAQSGVAPDGRPIYSRRAGTPAGNDYVIFNTDEGKAIVASIDLSKAWQTSFGRFALNIGYGHQNVDDVSSATSSTANSNFARTARSDPQNLAVATSNYETEHRIPLQLTWRHALFGEYATSVGLFVERRSGRPFSFTFGRGSGIFGDPGHSTSAASNDQPQLFYVPRDQNDVTLANGLTWAQLDDFITRNGLDAYRGQIVPRNAFRSPWVTSADLRITQELPAFFKDARGVLSIDIENVANLINSDWGRLVQAGFPHFQPVVDAAIVNGRYQYRPVAGATGPRDPFYSLTALNSVWRVQLGVRFEF
jgi:hypothetical protein